MNSITKLLEIAGSSRSSPQLISDWLVKKGLHAFFQQFSVQDLQQWCSELGTLIYASIILATGVESKTSSKAKLVDGIIASQSNPKKRTIAPKLERDPSLDVAPKPKKVKMEKVAPERTHIPTVYENGVLISVSSEMRLKLEAEAAYELLRFLN